MIRLLSDYTLQLTLRRKMRHQGWAGWSEQDAEIEQATIIGDNLQDFANLFVDLRKLMDERAQKDAAINEIIEG